MSVSSSPPTTDAGVGGADTAAAAAEITAKSLPELISILLDTTSTSISSSSSLSSLLSRLHSHVISLKDLIGALGPSLTAEEDATRVRATRLLCDVLSKSSSAISSSIPASSLATLFTFFIDRTSDGAAHRDVLAALHTLATQYGMRDTALLQRMCSSIFENVRVPSLPQSARKTVLDLLVLVLSSAPAAASALGEKFVTGFIASMDGEKDPRNLLVAFSGAAWVLRLFPLNALRPHAESLFEVISCYFPITFTAAKNDPHGISGDDLKTLLNDALSANAVISEWVFSLIIEKIDGDGDGDDGGSAAKADAYGLAAQCLARYDAPSCAPFFGALWQRMRKDLLQEQQRKAEASALAAAASGGSAPAAAPAAPSAYGAALAAFQSMVRLICPDTISGFPSVGIAPHFATVLAAVVSEALEEFLVPDTKMARQYAKILLAMISVSANAFVHVINEPAAPYASSLSSTTSAKEAPVLLLAVVDKKFYAASALHSQKLALLEFVYGVVQVAAKGWGDGVALPEHPFSASLPATLRLFLSAVVDGPTSEIRAIALRGLSTLALLEATPAEAVEDIVERLARAATNVDNELVRAHALDGLTPMAEHPRLAALVTRHCLPHLFIASATAATATPLSLNAELWHLNVFAFLSLSSPSFFHAGLPSLLQVVQRHFSAALQGRADALLHLQAVLSCLQTTLEKLCDSASGAAAVADTAPWLESAVALILLHAALSLSQLSAEFVFDSHVLQYAAQIMLTLTQASSAEQQQRMMNRAVAVFLDGDVLAYFTAMSGLQSSLPPLPLSQPSTSVPFRPLGFIAEKEEERKTAPRAHAQLLPLFFAVITAHRSADTVPRLPEIFQIIQRITQSAPTPSTAVVFQWAVHCLSAITIKLPLASPMLSTVCGLLVGDWKAAIADAATPLPVRQSLVSVFMHVSKSLLLRNHSLSSTILQTICSFLHPSSSSPSLSPFIADQFDFLLSDSLILSKRNFATIGVSSIFRQKFFAITLPILMEIFRDTKNRMRKRHGVEEKKDNENAMAVEETVPGAVTDGTLVILALSHVLRHVPKSVLMANLKDTLPMLVDAIHSPHSTAAALGFKDKLRKAAITTVAKLISDDIQSLLKNMDVNLLLKPLLEALNDQDQAVRLLSLFCLDRLCSASTSATHRSALAPHKPFVLSALVSALDSRDDKVRRAAVRCRNEWFLLESK